MKCIYTNACSVVGKIDDLRYLAQNEEPNIIGISETWANETISDADLHIEGYSLLCLGRIGSQRHSPRVEVSLCMLKRLYD